MNQKKKILKIHPGDNVLVALTDLERGTKIEFATEVYILKDTIEAKHKLASVELKQRDAVYMYGVIVGRAK